MQAIDVLQAASNAVAGNVTGPVDILSLLLRKIGVPVPENALGSSQWAREHGLLRDVDDPYARAAGESLGILAPMVAAAKAPQIARGLLQMGENAAAPRTMSLGPVGAQRGAVDVGKNRWELVPSGERFSNLDEADDFLYHVTSEPVAKKILGGGLTPRKGNGTFNHGAYSNYSQGKAFLTDRPGVSFWQSRIEDQLFDQFDAPPNLVTLRIPRSAVPDILEDALGSADARAASYYVTKPIK